MVKIPRSPGIAFVESQMVDECLITRETRGLYDNLLNEATGELYTASGLPDDDYTVYTGKCVISMIDKGDKELPVAEMPTEFNYWKVLLPMNHLTGTLRIGDEFFVTKSAYDDTFIGKEFRISKVDKGTHPVYRKIMIEEQTDAIGSSSAAS